MAVKVLEEAAGEQTAGAAGESEGYVGLLRVNRDFRLLWLGQVVSQLGDWFDTIALFTLVLKLTGSGRAVGLVLVARFLPSVVLGPLSGVLADRFNRRHIMIASDVARALVVLGFLFVRRPEQVWLVYLLTVLQLAFSAFFEPARSAALPSVVAERDLLTANSLSSVTWSAMLTLGAAVGGPITDWFGTDVAFVTDSLTYLVSAALVWSVRLPKRRPRPKTPLTAAKALGVADTLEGLRYVWHRPRVLALLLVKPAWGLGGGILTLLPVFGEKVFRLSLHAALGGAALGMSALYAARGVGTALGPVLTRRFYSETRAQMQRAIGVSFLVAGAFYVAFGGAQSFTLALLWLAVAHAGGSVLWVFSTVLLQSSVEDEFRGRVFAAELMLLTLALAASNYVTGEALDGFGVSPRAAAVAIGLLFFLPGVLWPLTRRWWDRERGK
ncbi:MAG: MFS transporter [Acidobacteria bacterium]|nr:MFS transporter [Acidobacteriota bacterium]